VSVGGRKAPIFFDKERAMDELIVKSIFDNDLYKFTMLQAVLDKCDGTPVRYVFNNRRKEGVFTPKFISAFDEQLDGMASLRVSASELDEFTKACPFFPSSFFSYLKDYRFNPNQVQLRLIDNEIEIGIEGPWQETILWEVPLLYMVSELYFKMIDTDWTFNENDQQMRLLEKALVLKDCNFADFGTRRRRNYDVQDLVVRTLMKSPGFVGTSNVHLALKHGVKPIGTMAHEWIMAMSVLKGMRHANKAALTAWSEVFNGDLGIALTDTFGTDPFFEDFDGYLARLFDGVRQDSGDPLEFGEKAINHYNRMGIDPMTKTIVFSDSLSDKKAAQISDRFAGRIRVSFGIGTHLTNDFPGSTPLNIVIKLAECNGVPVVKLGDDVGKAIGEKDALRVARWIFEKRPLDAPE